MFGVSALIDSIFNEFKLKKEVERLKNKINKIQNFLDNDFINQINELCSMDENIYPSEQTIKAYKKDVKILVYFVKDEINKIIKDDEND